MKIYKLKQIETPRLIIRPVQLGDEIELNKLVNNSIELLQKWIPWANDPSIEATRAMVQRGVFAWESGSIVNFPMVIIHKQDQKIIGGSGYNEHSDIKQRIYEIGYWCDVAYHGKGLVTECVNFLIRYAFEVLNASKVILAIIVNNKKSIAVANRLNFTNEGIKIRKWLGREDENLEKHYYIYSVSNTDSLLRMEGSFTHAEDDNINRKIIIWAKEILHITNEDAFASSKVIIKTPWSNVIAINTGNELVYLKHTPKQIALEAEIIQILRDQFNAFVPIVIAQNIELNCFLMKDAGTSLRSILKKTFDIELLCKAIDQFTSLQITVADHTDVFLNIGVPDWRLNKLPDLYKKVISQKDWLIADGLSEVEINELEALLPKITYLCVKLSNYSIKQTIVQPDFSDNNILIDNKSQTITIIDLGEIVISHPFFSLINCLHVIKKHYSLTNQDDIYLKIKNVCLKNYLNFESEQNVIDVFEIAHILWFVYGLLASDRLMQACGKEKLMSFQRGKLSLALKEFIALCKKIL
jgi:RimJ/RimL family protein N-acetyltransferase